MNFATLSAHATEQSLSVLEGFPALVSVHGELLDERPKCKGGHSLESGVCSELPADARIIADVFDPRRNKLLLTVLTNEGAVKRTFRARLNVDKRLMEGSKTFMVKVLRIPPATARYAKGILQDMQGKEYKFPRNKFTQEMQRTIADWVYKYYQDLKWPLAHINWSKVPKGVQNDMNFEELQKCSWLPDGVKVARASGKVVYQLLHAPGHQLELSEAVESGLIPEYPVVNISGRVLHKWNTLVKVQYMGVIQEGGASNYTKNTQTANRISAALGETVTPEQLHQLRFTHSLNSIYLGNGIHCCPFAVVTKVTKEV